MPPKFARSSVHELFHRYLGMTNLAGCVLALSGCSAIQAEVGSGLPPLDAQVPDAPGSAPCDTSGPLRLYYRNGHLGDSTNIIDYLVKVENASGAPLAPASLNIRYYLTNELAPPTTIEVFYSDTCCSNKIVNFNAQVVASVQPLGGTTGADAYLDIGFASSLGPLAAGDAIQVEIGFGDPAFARNLIQTNDYSYQPAAAGTQAEWDSCPGPQCNVRFTSCLVTVYRDDVLVWGSPP